MKKVALPLACLFVAVALSVTVTTSILYWLTPQYYHNLMQDLPPAILATSAHIATTSTTVTTGTLINTIRQPQRPAIVYLGNEEHFGDGRDDRESCKGITDSLLSLARHFPSTTQEEYDPVVFILHDDELTNVTRQRLTQASPFPIYFYKIIFQQPRDEMWKDVDNLDYKRMCAFWFHYFFELDFLPDYVMRLDTDSCLTSNMEIQPFQYMKTNNIEYMYNSFIIEPPDVITDLREFTIQNPGTPTFNNSNDPLIFWRSDDIDDVKMETVGTNLEWFYIPAFRRPCVLAWKELVHQHGGIFRYRWGDAPLRSLVVAKFFNSTRVTKFCHFYYNHSSWGTEQACTTDKDDFITTSFGWNRMARNVATGKAMLG